MDKKFRLTIVILPSKTSEQKTRTCQNTKYAFEVYFERSSYNLFALPEVRELQIFNDTLSEGFMKFL